MNTNANKTRVRYGVHYNDRNYEYVLHSNKKFFLKNLADVLNVIEYCVTQELKKNNFKADSEKMLNIDIIRFVNDKEDESWDKSGFKATVQNMIVQMISDTIQRNK